MRVDHNRTQISLAAFLMCLLGVYAVSPIDYFCRTQVGSRGRAARTCRLDDHDHQDHALDAVNLISDSLGDHGGDGSPFQAAVLPEGLAPPGILPFAGLIQPIVVGASATYSPAYLGRAPPSFC